MKNRELLLSERAASTLSKLRPSTNLFLEKSFEVLRHAPEEGTPLCPPIENIHVLNLSPGIRIVYTFTKDKLQICALHVAPLLQNKQTNRFGAVLLAAGEGSCCGKPEQLAPTSRGPALDAALTSITRASVSSLVLVAGHEATKVRAHFGQDCRMKNVTFTYNKNYEGPLSQSLKVGLKVIEPGLDGVLLCLGNRPLINWKTIKKMIEKFKKERPLVVRPWFDSRPGHPVLFDSSMSHQLIELSNKSTPRQLLTKCGDILDLKVEDPGVVTTVKDDCGVQRL